MKAIIAGTFDPFTLGHMDLVERAISVFGSVAIAVAEQTGKVGVSGVGERIAIIETAVCGVSGIEIEKFDGLLSDYVAKNGSCVLVRGLRSVRDFEYERDITRVYKSLCGAETVFLTTSAATEHISSTVVREIASLGGRLDGYVSPKTYEMVYTLYGNNKNKETEV